MAGSDLNETAANPPLPAAETRVGYISSPLLEAAGFRHAFFTRVGGVSRGPYASLSFSTSAGDDACAVEENLRRAAGVLGVDAARVLYTSQVHGATALFTRGEQQRSDVIELENDAIGGREPGHAYAVRSADCVPILVADTVSSAVIAIHAGWRGLVNGIIESAIARLLCETSSTSERLLAAIGPHISVRAFEVSDDVASALNEASPAAGAVRRNGAKAYVSLSHIARAKLLELGFASRHIDETGGCTASEPDRFFSFRRDGKTSGRHLSAIVPRL
jgi:hypothetical protein